MKRFLAKKGIKNEIKALKKVKALLLLVLNFLARFWGLAS